MYKGFQTIKYPLPSIVWAASTRFVVRLRDLPVQWFNRVSHLRRILFGIPLAETFGGGTGGTRVTDQFAFANRIELFDGTAIRFTGDGRDLRDFERIENGGLNINDGLHNGATTVVRHWRRVLEMGPPRMAGSPTDFVYPCGAMENGELRLTTGAVTDADAQVTAITGTIEVTAELVLLDKIRVAPFVDRVVYTVGADTPIMGKGLYLFIAAARIAARTAYTTGQIGAVTIDTGQGQLVPAVNAWNLTAAYNADFGRGEIGGLIGDPATATDTGNRTLGDDEALAAQSLDLQAYAWMPPGGRLSKCVAQVESTLRVRHSGSLATGTEVLLVTRILPQTPTVVGNVIDKACKQLGWKNGRVKLALESGKASYSGPIAFALPFDFKQAA